MRLKLAIGLMAVAGLALPAAHGQEPEDEGAKPLEELIVTARRREESAQDVPIPLTAMSEQMLRDRGVHDLRELTNVTPNLQFLNSGVAKNTAQVFLRGIGQVNWAPVHDPKIGTYMDGIYLGRPQGGVFDFLDIDRVEVLRGPQGTLFGRNTTAGLVHVISNRPRDAFDYSIGAGVGNDGILTAEGMVNVPISDTLAARLAFQHRESDGYVHNTATGEDWSDENSQGARLSLRFTPNDRVTADLIIEAQRARELSTLGSCEWTEPDDGSQTGAFLPLMAFVFNVYDEIRDACNSTRPYASNDNDPDPESEVDAYSGTLDLNVDVGFGDLTYLVSYREVTTFNGSWGWGSDNATSSSFLEVLGVQDNPAEQWSHEIRLAGTALEDSLDWVVGVYMFEEEATNTVDVPILRGASAPDCATWPIWCAPSFIPGLTFGQFAQGGVQIGGSRTQYMHGFNDSRAVFGEVTWRFAEGWSVTAGARYTEDDREFMREEILSIGVPDPTLACPPGTPPPRNGTTCFTEASFDEVTPRIIFSWHVRDNAMLYLGWSKGYSSGGFNQDVRMRPFEPEISGNWEGGLKSTWKDGLVMLNLTAFRNSYENQQITVGRLVDGNPTADLINAQDATLHGIEGEFRAELGGGFYTLGAFGWMDGEYDEFSVQDNQIVNFQEVIVTRDLSETEVVRGSPYTYSVAIGKNQALASGGAVNAQVGWAFRGRLFNTLETARSSRQGKYGLLDARLTWALADGQTTVSVWGTNLLGRLYYPTAVDLSVGDSRSGTITKYWGEPRRFGLEVSYRMGQ